MNRNQLKTSKIKLKELACLIDVMTASKFQSICDVLNVLHKNGLYEKLQLYSYSVSQEMINQMAAVNALNKRWVKNFNHIIIFEEP